MFILIIKWINIKMQERDVGSLLISKSEDPTSILEITNRINKMITIGIETVRKGFSVN